MRLYKVRVRRWYPPENGKPPKGVWCDERVLVEAESLDEASVTGYEAIMGSKFFGVDPTHCQTMETASVMLPYCYD